MTKPRTMQANRKFIMRRPCQMFRVSTSITGAANADEAAAIALLASFLCSPATLTAVAPQISQVLPKKEVNLSEIEDRNDWGINKILRLVYLSLSLDISIYKQITQRPYYKQMLSYHMITTRQPSIFVHK